MGSSVELATIARSQFGAGGSTPAPDGCSPWSRKYQAVPNNTTARNATFTNGRSIRSDEMTLGKNGRITRFKTSVAGMAPIMRVTPKLRARLPVSVNEWVMRTRFATTAKRPTKMSRIIERCLRPTNGSKLARLEIVAHSRRSSFAALQVRSRAPTPSKLNLRIRVEHMTTAIPNSFG